MSTKNKTDNSQSLNRIGGKGKVRAKIFYAMFSLTSSGLMRDCI